MGAIQELCKDDDYVRGELLKARELMTTKGTDLANLTFAVGLVYIHCGEKWRDIAEATLLEINYRRLFAPLKGSG